MRGVTFEVERPESRSGVLLSGKDFRLRSDELFRPLVSDGPPLVSDLFLLSASVYAIDRLVKRSFQSALRGPGRVLQVRARVSEPGFWAAHNDLLREILHLLSGDQWRFDFEKAPAAQWQRSFLESKDAVCLYSGGLDSLAGLAHRLKEGGPGLTSVTMLHVGRQKDRVQRHIRSLNAEFGNRVFPVLVPMALVNPPRLDHQELSQRCRGFIFASLGIGAAAATGAERIEIYENGVGALNVPLMGGMSVCGRSTKGCHPRFMDLMTRLGSAVLGREVRFLLPFVDKTKGEVVAALKCPRLAELAQSSFSCIHTSPRVKGDPRHCGICPACIGRRQAFRVAGVTDDPDKYVTDIFDAKDANALADDEIAFLKATLMQVARLASSPGGLPPQVDQYLRVSEVPEEEGGGWPRATAMLHRYRSEWEEIADMVSTKGVHWGTWLGPREQVDV
jgi:7-cyano-7-deazaguanine synthase in queuosine biosynthesis